MNIFKYELYTYRKSFVIWSGSLSILTILFMMMFPSFAHDSEQLLQLLKSYPPALLKALNISSDLFTILGFYSYLFTYIALCGAIQALNLGLSLLSKETREKTADFLLTKPVTRTQIVTAKGAAAFVSLILTNLIFIFVAYVSAMAVKTADFDLVTFLLISISLFFIQGIFLVLGFVISVCGPKFKSVIGMSLGVVFLFFGISMIGGATQGTALYWFTPFKYFDPLYILEHSTYDWKYVFVSMFILVFGIITSYVVYNKKDIDAV